MWFYIWFNRAEQKRQWRARHLFRRNVGCGASVGRSGADVLKNTCTPSCMKLSLPNSSFEYRATLEQILLKPALFGRFRDGSSFRDFMYFDLIGHCFSMLTNVSTNDTHLTGTSFEQHVFIELRSSVIVSNTSPMNCQHPSHPLSLVSSVPLHILEAPLDTLLNPVVL